MPGMIQIRNVPEELHRRLKARAALAGMSMSELIQRELAKAMERPTREELLAEIRASSQAELEPDAATVVRSERDAR